MLLGIPPLTWNLPWPATWLLHHEDHRKSASLQRHALHGFDLNIKVCRTSESLAERIQGQKPQYYHLDKRPSALNWSLTVKEKHLSLKINTSAQKNIWTSGPGAHIATWSCSCKGCCIDPLSLKAHVLNSLTLLQTSRPSNRASAKFEKRPPHHSKQLRLGLAKQQTIFLYPR